MSDVHTAIDMNFINSKESNNANAINNNKANDFCWSLYSNDNQYIFPRRRSSNY